MKNILIIIPFLIFFACSTNKSESTDQDLSKYIAMKDFYCSNMDESVYLKRCDKSTFMNLQDAICGNVDLSGFEWADGEYHRDVKPNVCFPNDSKSEISPDFFITKFHSLVSRSNADALFENKRLNKYAREHDYVMGDGDNSITGIRHLLPWMNMVTGYLEKNVVLLADSDDAIPVLATHDKYLSALTIWLHGRIKGGISELEMYALRQLVDDDPNSPIFQSLLALYRDGNFHAAMGLLDRFCPVDEIPLDDGFAKWGSSPRSIHCIVTVGIMLDM